jgi:lysophospholipase L1-like esterase
MASILMILMASCGSQSSPLSPDRSAPPAESSVDRETTGPLVERSQQAPPFRRILCFGDSITLGVTSRGFFERFSLSPVEGYIPKLKRLLRQEFGDRAQLFNSGVGGETTGQGLERLRIEIRSARYDLVLLLEGVVDVNNDEPAFEEARANLKEMIRVVKGEGIPVIIATIPPLNADGFRTEGIQNVPKLNDVIRSEAEAEGVPLADHEKAFRRNPGLQGPDGLHPNDSGYEVMAETWFEAIVDLAAGLET